MAIKDFTDLNVWKISSELSRDIAFLIRTFPNQEKYELNDDLLRAARSIPSNISEGFGRYHFNEKIQFYNIARGSSLEVRNHLIEAKNLSYIREDTFNALSKRCHIIEIKINNLIKSTVRAKKKYSKK